MNPFLSVATEAAAGVLGGGLADLALGLVGSRQSERPANGLTPDQAPPGCFIENDVMVCDDPLPPYVDVILALALTFGVGYALTRLV